MLTPQQQIKKIRAELSDYAGEARAPSWKRECRDWCKKADLWTIIDAGEFVDSVGYRHALGVAFAIVEDFDSVDLAAEQSELEPAGNLTAVLKGGLSKGVSSLGVVCVYQKDAENLGTGDRCFISVSALD